MFLLLFLIVITTGLFFAFQSVSFQTWAAQKVTAYLSNEFNARVEIGRVEIQFFRTVLLKDVFIEDLHGDTLLYGNQIDLKINHFSFEEQMIDLKSTELKNIKVKLLKYPTEDDFNFQFIADYFSSSDTTKSDSTATNWRINYGDLILNDVDFTYHLLRDTMPVVRNMNYNHIHVHNVYGKFSEIEIHQDTIKAQITNLKAKEHCGIELTNLTTKATVSSSELACDNLYLETANSRVIGKLNFKYEHWEDYEYFVDRVYMKSNIQDSSKLNLKDIAYFAEDLNGINEEFAIKGNVNGYVNHLNGSDLDIKYRNHTQFKGDFTIVGLPDFDSSFVHFDAKKLATSVSDIEAFPLPPFSNPEKINLPKELKRLGIVSFKGKFDGFLNDFATYGTIKTAVGNLKTDIHLTTNSKSKLVEYSGKLRADNLDISKIVQSNSPIGKISFEASVKGKGITLKDLDATVDGKIFNANLNSYNYNDVIVKGAIKNKVFNGDLISKDENCDFDFSGSVDFNGKVPKMDFISTVHNFDLDKTNLSLPKLNGKFSSQILINLNGDDIDNLTGIINFDNTHYETSTKRYKLNTFNFELNQETKNKELKLSSDIANLHLYGAYKLSTLSDAFMQYLNSYYPTFFKAKTNYIFNDKADLSIRIKKFQIIQELFLNDLQISNNSQINASFDAGISFLYITTKNDFVKYSNILFKNNNLLVNSLPTGISLSYRADRINTTDSVGFANTNIKLLSNDKITNFDVNWDNKVKPNYVSDIAGKIMFGSSEATLVFDKFMFSVADSIWQQIKPAPITIDTGFVVNISPLTFYNQNQLITLEGKISKNSNDKLDVFIQNFQLSQINKLFKNNALFKVDGMLTGNINVFGVLGNRIITSHSAFSDLKLNNKIIGNGEINADYNQEKEYVKISGYSAFSKDFDGNLMKNIEFLGYFFPNQKEDNIDITFKAEPFDVALLQPLFKDILTVKIGFVNGHGKVTGTITEPKINAKLKFFKCIMMVDYLNTQYGVSGEIDIKPTQINFENIEIRDKLGNLGSVYGNIFHKNFNDIRIDFDVNTKRLMLLNTTVANNPTFYGTVFGTGNAGIYGYLDDIKMEINMKTNGGSNIYIPLDGPSEVGNNEFIRFISKDTIKPKVVNNNSHFSVDLNLEATSDAEVQLIFDEKSGDVIKARGDGNLNMKINSKGKFDMFGDYVLSTGDYLFTLENFITKKFEIQKGSNIKWNGNAYKADIDITAIYRQRASVRPIYPADSSGKRYPVECRLLMKDKLTSPDIKFGIELPTIDESSRSAIKSILTDESELNRQFFSLLLLRSFVTPVSASGTGGITAGGAFANTGSEMLSNKLSNWLNGVTKEVDIGVNYRPGSGLSSDELDLTLNKQLFNNRVVIDGNLGVANSNTRVSNSSNIIGDVSIEYKLSQSGKYRVKAFNRSNDNTQVINSGGPYTQGLGVFYREEFESLNELYRRFLNKVKKTETNPVN
jgi:hypothetical protein